MYGRFRSRPALSSFPPPPLLRAPTSGQKVKGTRDQDTSFAILSGQYCSVILLCAHHLDQIRSDLSCYLFHLCSLRYLSSSFVKSPSLSPSFHPTLRSTRFLANSFGETRSTSLLLRVSRRPLLREHRPRKYLNRYPRISANILRDVVPWPSAPTAKPDSVLPLRPFVSQRLTPPPMLVGSTATADNDCTIFILSQQDTLG